MKLSNVVFDVATNKPLELDLDEIVKSRALIQANSGGGKSFLVRRFLEASYGKKQQIIIDHDGEYATLREKYSYILVAKGSQADIQLDIRHAALLARRLMETGANAIIDLYELSPFDRIKFVDIFGDALLNLPKNLWHECYVVVDEIHIFAPESGKGNSGALETISSLASRGRRRGLALIGATQKLSKFNKDVAAELNTKFTGRCILDIDQKRAASELGIKDYKTLRNLKYEFWAFGPAISGEPVLVKSYPVETRHEDIQSVKEYKVADKEKITQLINKSFAEIPKEAENELKTVEDLKRKINEQTMQIRTLQISKPLQVDTKQLEQEKRISYQNGFNACEKQYKAKLEELRVYYNRLKLRIAELGKLGHDIEQKAVVTDAIDTKITIVMDEPVPTQGYLAHQNTFTKVPKEISEPIILRSQSAESISPGQMKKASKDLLIAIAQSGGTATRKKSAALARIAITKSTFRNAVSELKIAGFITVNGDELSITQEGYANLGKYEPLPSDHSSLLQFWKSELKSFDGKILEKLCSVYPNFVDNTDLADSVGSTTQISTFRNAISKLNSLGLIEKKGSTTKADDGLFPEQILN